MLGIVWIVVYLLQFLIRKNTSKPIAKYGVGGKGIKKRRLSKKGGKKNEYSEIGRKKKGKSEKTEEIVAKALDGQRYPLPLSECMRCMRCMCEGVRW